jgi:hypothetical protein
LQEVEMPTDYDDPDTVFAELKNVLESLGTKRVLLESLGTDIQKVLSLIQVIEKKKLNKLEL